MYNLVNLKGKKIIVFGASSGIGKATALLLDKLECSVILVARREELLKEAVQAMQAMQGKNHRYYSFDLSETDHLQNFCKKIVEENGMIDGFVYSAGIAGNRPLNLMKPEYLLDIFQINTLAFVELVRCLTKKNCFHPGMSIVSVSSISSLVGNKGKAGYCASKGAMDAAVRAMARELAPKNIRVNTVCPGLLKTSIYDSYIEGAGGQSADFQNIVERQYLGLGEAEDVANLIAFLLSEASRFITGTSVVIDGGRTTS